MLAIPDGPDRDAETRPAWPARSPAPAHVGGGGPDHGARIDAGLDLATHGSEENFVTIRTGTLGVRALLLVIAIICFVVAALGIDVGKISLVAVGLAFFAASFLVEGRGM